MEKSFLPEKAFNLFQQAENDYKNTGSFSEKTLLELDGYFGEPLHQATVLLEKCKIIGYSIQDALRKIYKLSTTREQYIIFEKVNFCHCNVFKNKVLDTRQSLSCQHVLAVSLAKIMGKTVQEVLSDELYEDFLNEQLYHFMDLDTQSEILGKI